MSRPTAAKLLIKPGGSLWISDPDRLADDEAPFEPGR